MPAPRTRDDLLVIVPTRSRPDSVPQLLTAWRETGATADLLFAIDEDDPRRDDYLAHKGAQFTVGPRLRLVGTLNDVAVGQAPRYRYLAFMGDDHRPRPADRPWDARIRECLSGGPGIVYGNDLLQGENMPTAVAMTSDIVTALGYMAPPSMIHLCVDLVWKDWGTGMGRITYLPDMIIEHLHPANGKAELDPGYEECNSTAMVDHDNAAYHAYRDGGGLNTDLTRLRALLEDGPR
ncbi:hypothetical protein HHL19_16530 [Streptomyces sp. R302]|uniref:hypothetical protein n=1 Tax=unclassified Streptomyces TaxID=2593676 RepID=UPI00145CFDBC|nr:MULTISPECIES: hypothetical protein [unclassified Streptomyces]NML55376.1 hypothetical protein [Streptomyces sp. R301]NML80248.1 hypothetical protein [Streptomyces sp. R302]